MLTRLHYRYGKDDLGEDLVFKAAPPIDGGRGTPNRDGELRRETRAGGMNQFQGRYAILHRWEGEIACDNPRRGRWGGPPGSRPQPDPMAAGSRLRRGGGSGGGAKDDSAASDKELAALVRDAIPALDLTPAAKAQARETEEGQGADEQEQAAAQEPQQQQDDDGCDSCVMTGATLPRGLGTGLPVVAALLLVRARRRRRR